MDDRTRWLAFVLLAGLVVLPACKKGTQGIGMRPNKPTAEDVAKAEQALTGMKSGPVLLGASLLPPLPRQQTLQETAADALARIGPDAVPSLVQALRDYDPAVRNQAALALARMGPDASAAVPALMEALNDRDETVRLSAARALGQIGPPARAAVPALVAALRHRTG